MDRKPALLSGALLAVLVTAGGVFWFRSQEAPAAPPRTTVPIESGTVFSLPSPVDPAREPISLDRTEPIEMVVYLTPTCGCCSLWVEHIAEYGFDVDLRYVTDPDLYAVKATNAVQPELSSCHTAIVNGYVVEGHVPGDVVRQFLADAPQVRGLTVPGMPVGSPGMEFDDRVDPYDVLAFTSDGRTVVYSQQGRN